MTFGLFSKPSLDSELLSACSRADEAKALALLAWGARPSSSGPQGSTCLMFAARHDLPELFLTLCKSPGLAHARDQRGRGALHWASVRRGFAKSAQLSDLFERVEPALFDMSGLDDQGRHPIEAAIASSDKSACVFWFRHAPARLAEQAIGELDNFARACGFLEKIESWRREAERLDLAYASSSLFAYNRSSSPRL